MNIGLLINDGTVRKLERALLTTGILAGATIIVLGGAALFFRAGASHANHRMKTAQSELESARAIAKEGAALKRKIPPFRMADALQLMEAEFDRAANAEKVQVVSFDSHGSPVPYTSKYNSAIAGEGWMMTEIQVTMRGATPGIERVLRRLGKAPLPIELTALTLDAAGDGSPDVTSLVTFTLIGRETDAKTAMNAAGDRS